MCCSNEESCQNTGDKLFQLVGRSKFIGHRFMVIGKRITCLQNKWLAITIYQLRVVKVDSKENLINWGEKIRTTMKILGNVMSFNVPEENWHGLRGSMSVVLLWMKFSKEAGLQYSFSHVSLITLLLDCQSDYQEIC